MIYRVAMLQRRALLGHSYGILELDVRFDEIFADESDQAVFETFCRENYLFSAYQHSPTSNRDRRRSQASECAAKAAARLHEFSHAANYAERLH
jgi:hypothetical protein